MTKKFDLIDFGEDKAKDIAEIMSNKTCRKMLDFLKEKEATETEISERLDMALSTVHYNLQKLVKAKLVDIKDFYWSPKGNKVHIYKAINKTLIITHKKSVYLENKLKMILPLIIIASLLVILSVLFLYPQTIEKDQVKKFNSLDEIKNFLRENSAESLMGTYNSNIPIRGVAVAGTFSGSSYTSGVSNEKTVDFSKTNIQVEGVDEADIIKSDGKYIYTISGNKVIIVDAYPAENSKILSEIELNGINKILINDNRLIVFVIDGKTSVLIYDVADKKNPVLENNISIEGNYLDSRMIKDYVYVISSKTVEIDNPVPPIYTINGIENAVSPNEIYYFDFPDKSYVFTSITSINIKENKFENKVYLIGSTSNIYVSPENIYLTYTKSISTKEYFERFVEEVLIPLLPSSESEAIKNIINSDEPIYEKMRGVEEIVENYSNSLTGNEKAKFDEEFMNKLVEFDKKLSKESEKTVIHKINLNELDIKYKTVGEVNGHILNQFSMDEYGGYFRIATTTGRWTGENLNHIYVLNEGLDIVGSVEDLAEGEKIYSVRFLMDKGYLVTFRQTDPFFVVDLSIPENPKVTGELKIPGYSNYLHPYDENHVIGIGKEADENGRFQGIKMALFDVSDVKNPKEIYDIIIGERGTESEVLNDHKAFLFDKEKNLLVLPINLVSQDQNFQGAYVYELTLEKGFKLNGIISHYEDEENISFSKSFSIKRSLYINDILYTLSKNKIMFNSLNDLKKIKEFEIDEILLYDCGSLNIEGGFYKLQNDISTSKTCFVIEANNVILDLNGHILFGNGSEKGIYIPTFGSTIIKNGKILNFAEGIESYQSSGNIIKNNTINNNRHQGIYLFRGGENKIYKNNISGNSYDYGFGEIELDGSDNNLIQDNSIENGNEDGIHVFNSNNNILINNHIKNNKNLGIDLNMASNNIVENNIIEKNGAYGIYVGGGIGMEGKNNVIKNNTLLENQRGTIELTGTSGNFNIVISNIIL
ncbi:beta-propeller domain-containing protein [Candidatus Pacearchaeota archaeon]|nr:beta-propeller domain-containing protein [Candidatus Pacearchaeota archaeon]